MEDKDTSVLRWLRHMQGQGGYEEEAIIVPGRSVWLQSFDLLLFTIVSEDMHDK